MNARELKNAVRRVNEVTYNAESGSVISSVRVEKNPRHWHLHIWNRGGKAGTLIVNAEDGPAIVDRLMASREQFTADATRALDAFMSYARDVRGDWSNFDGRELLQHARELEKAMRPALL